MKMQENRVRKFLSNLGYVSASARPINELVKTLTHAAKTIGDDYEPKDDRDAKLFKRLSDAVEAGEPLEIVPEESDDSTEEAPESEEIVRSVKAEEMYEDDGDVVVVAPPKKRGRPKAVSNGEQAKTMEEPKKRGRPKKGEVREKKTKSEDRETDKFGSYVGSSNAKVNSVLTKKPKTFAQICEETGLSRGQVRYKHLEALVEEGLLVKDGATWALKK